MHGNCRAHPSARIAHRHGQAHRSVEELAGVGRHAGRVDLRELALERIEAHDRALGVARQRPRAEEPLPLRERHIGEQQLAARRAVQRHPRAELDPQAAGLTLDPELFRENALLKSGPDIGRHDIDDDDLLPGNG